MMQRLHVFSLTLLLGALLAAGLAFAEGTAVNERITNVATATYNDSSGDPQTTTSNPVTTIVQQVYDFTILPDGTEAAPGQTESALPGAPVYFNYTVTNTGNGIDTIDLVTDQSAADNFDLTSPTIYLDTGCDGSVAGDSVVSSVTLDADESACIIVAGTIPNTATDGQVGNVNIEGTSQGDNTVTDTNNWAQAVANTAGNLTGNKVASPASGTPVAAGGTISYTVTGSNNGGGAAYGTSITVDGTAVVGIAITDALDANVTYTATSLSGTAGAGTVTPIYSTDNGATWTATEPAAASVTNVGMVIVDPAPTSAFFPQTANYSMTFDVTVDTGVLAGTSITNSADIEYDTDGAGGDPPSTTTTNTTNNPVAASYDVAIGPSGQPDTDGLSGAASYTDPATGDTWNVTLSGGYTAQDDTQTITDTVTVGDTVAFRHTLENLGTANDSFDISAVSAEGNTVTLYQADGVTPLLGSVGPLAPGGTLDIVVKVNVTDLDADTVTVTATSTTSGAASDISTDAIPEPVSQGIDLATNDDGAAGGESGDNDPTDDDPANQTAAPGDVLTYPIEFTNTGNQDDQDFTISETLPADWTVQYFADADCDGVADTPGTPLASDTFADVDAGVTVCAVAEVTVPATATNDSDPNTTGFQPYDVDFTITNDADPTVTDTISTQVTVQEAELEFITDQTATTSPDSTVTYTHTLINSGNAPVDVDIPAQTGTTFTYQYAVDTDGDGDFSDETFTADLTAVTVAGGDTETIFVRVVVPDTAQDGDSETVTVEAQVGGVTVDSVQDTTIVQAGELDLVKSAVAVEYDGDCDAGNTSVSATAATAEPGDCIRYTVVATNIGSADLTNVKVSDPLPAFTDFVSVSASSTATGTILYSTDGTAWSATAPVALTTGSTVYAAVDTNADTNITAADILAPSETVTLTFVVRVQ